MEEFDLKQSFQVLEEDLRLWGQEVDNILISKVLKKHHESYKIKIEPKSRVKNISSFIAKALYRNKAYEDPILQIEDKVATRVVFLLTSELEEAQNQILEFEGWKSKLTKDFNVINQEDAEKFGYQSIHIIVWLINRPDITCEIQLRTLLQHAYSEMSHDNIYKGPYKSDTEIIRRLSKSMALMEATDDYFCDIYERIGKSNNTDKMFVENLIIKFIEFEPNFAPEALDKNLIELILKFINDNEISVSIEDINSYTYKETQSLSISIGAKTNYLVQQPSILLLGHLMESHSEQIKNNLPLPYNTKKEIFKTFGVAFN